MGLCVCSSAVAEDVQVERSPDAIAEQVLLALDAQQYARAAELLQDVTKKDMTPKMLYAFGWCAGLPACMGGTPEEAFVYFKRSATAGYAPAQKALAICYKNGAGVTTNYKKAARWYLQAAEQGLKEAQFELAAMFCSGTGVPRDYELCRNWLEKSAKQGHAAAARVLGRMYTVNPAGWKDTKNLAKTWYKKSYYLGDMKAAYALAQIYLLEDKADDAKEWIREAAKLGHAEAQWNMAGFSTDPEKVYEWADKAARNGHMEASLALAEYFKRAGSDKDKEYLRIAAKAGSKTARKQLCRLRNVDKRCTLLGLDVKGATRDTVVGYLKEKGLESAPVTLDGMLRYGSQKLELEKATCMRLWFNYEQTEKPLTKVQYELAYAFSSVQEVATVIKSLEPRFGAPYNHTPFRINPHKPWAVFWAIPDVDITLAYTPEKGVLLTMKPAEDVYSAIDSEELENAEHTAMHVE